MEESPASVAGRATGQPACPGAKTQRAVDARRARRMPSSSWTDVRIVDRSPEVHGAIRKLARTFGAPPSPPGARGIAWWNVAARSQGREPRRTRSLTEREDRILCA